MNKPLTCLRRDEIAIYGNSLANGTAGLRLCEHRSGSFCVIVNLPGGMNVQEWPEVAWCDSREQAEQSYRYWLAKLSKRPV